MKSKVLLWQKIEPFLEKPPYFPCLLLVHPEMTRLHTAVSQLYTRYAWPQLNLGQIISQELRSFPSRRWPAQAPRATQKAIVAHKPGPLICTDIDLLFEPQLRIDPLRIFLDTSRHTILVIAWPGSYHDNVLTYAVPEHDHYHTWTQPDICDYCLVLL